MFVRSSFIVRLLGASVLLLGGVGAASADKPDGPNYDLRSYMASVDFSCSKDSDCVIKDVHNCCGYYPKCVNRAAKVDAGYVKKACAEQGLASVCGFPSITSCHCSNGTCAADSRVGP